MKYAFFQGCHIPIRIEHYAAATEAVFNRFGIELVEIREFNCCGYPVRNVDEDAYILPSARNMALAEKEGLDIMVICNCCFASLQKAKNVLENDARLREKVGLILAKEGLAYTGKVKIRHYLTLLHDEIGTDVLAKALVKKFTDLNIAVLQGCHILRPREIMRFDDSFVPRITEELLRLTGVNTLDWRGKLECCGAALSGINDDLSRRLLEEKIVGAREAGADYITPICAYCYLQLDTAQKALLADAPKTPLLPVILYPQLLGLCLGIPERQLGLAKNTTLEEEDIRKLSSLLGPPTDEKEKKRKARKKKKKQAASPRPQKSA